MSSGCACRSPCIQSVKMNLLAAVRKPPHGRLAPTRITRPCGAQRTSSEGPERQNRKRFLNNPSRPPLMNDQPHNQNKSRPAINPARINSNSSIRRQFPPLIGEMKIHAAKAPPRKAFTPSARSITHTKAIVSASIQLHYTKLHRPDNRRRYDRLQTGIGTFRPRARPCRKDSSTRSG